MKQNIMYKLMICLLVIIMITQTGSGVLAHLTSQKGILANDGDHIGGDDVGWRIDERVHTHGINTSYHFSNTDTYLTSKYKNYVIDGAKKWSSVFNITQKPYGSGTGEISTYYQSSSSTVAEFCGFSGNSSGHLTSWKIRMNRAHTMNATVLAHEFGHVIGLNDLYGSKSTGKLMYGKIGGTATGPTSSDKWGAKVITGVHYTHTWGYKYYKTDSAGNIHVKYCTQCNGYSVTTEHCKYNANNVCTKCGTPKGSTPYSLDNSVPYGLCHP